MTKKRKELTKAPSETTGGSLVGGSLHDLRDRMDRLFNDLLAGRGSSGFGSVLGEWDPWPGLRADGGDITVPAMDVVESNGGYTVTVELPGVEEKEVDVTVSRGLLTVRGEKKQEKEKKEDDRRLTERRYGSFARSIRVPEGIDEDAVSAIFDKGVLKITLPKGTEKKVEPRKINVAAA